jgi:hypothetical protein
MVPRVCEDILCEQSFGGTSDKLTNKDKDIFRGVLAPYTMMKRQIATGERVAMPKGRGMER